MDLSKISTILLIIISVTGSIINGPFTKVYVRKNIMHASEHYLLNGIMNCFTFTILLIVSLFNFNISWFSVVVGVFFGIITALNNIFSSLSYKTGPLSYTTIIINLSTIITAFSGFFFFSESIDILKISGMILLIICFVLSVDKFGDKEKANLKWTIFCLLASITCAGVGLTQKIHQTNIEEFCGNIYVMLITSFLIGAIYSFIMYAIFSKKDGGIKRANGEKPFSIKYLFFASFVLGLCMADAHLLNLYLVGVIDTAIFFPIINGVPLIGTLFISFIFLKERLTRRQVVGIILGLIGIVFLGVNLSFIPKWYL